MIVTCGQMKDIERMANEEGLSYTHMMENAGTAVSAWIQSKIDVVGKNILVFCGKGNNGGDGFVAAKLLNEKGANVSVILCEGDPCTDDAKLQFLRLRESNVKIISFKDDTESFIDAVRNVDIAVDTIYGTGFHGEIRENVRDIFRVIGALKAYPNVKIFSVDVPSGVNADSGEYDVDAVKADYTCAIHALKPVHIMKNTKKLCGEVDVLSIGIPTYLNERIERSFFVTDKSFVWDTLKVRPEDSNKGTFGKLLNVSGSLSMSGAAFMSTSASIRAGAGLVTLATTKTLAASFAGKLVQCTFLPLNEDDDGFINTEHFSKIDEKLSGMTACLVGCGLGTSDSAKRLVYHIIENADCPIIIDADGINAVSSDIDILKRAKAPVVITPHVGEMSRLTGESIEKIKENPYLCAANFAKEYNVTVVLKDYITVIASPDSRIYTNTTGNAGLAKGGSGDVLAGIIAGFAAQKIPVCESAVCGVYLHGAAADRCAKRKSQYAMQPVELLDDLCEIFAENGR